MTVYLHSQTNGGIGIRPEVFDGQTVAWDTNANYGNYWSLTKKQCKFLYPMTWIDYTIMQYPSNRFDVLEELVPLDFDGDGDIQIDDCLQLRNMNTQFVEAWLIRNKNIS